MPLYPNLHLLIPGAEGVLIEARIYLPRSEALRGLPLNNSESSTPTPLTSLAAPARAALTRLGIRRVVTAAHPYARLGGNMMFP
jgi:hypothetical protein